MDRNKGGVLFIVIIFLVQEVMSPSATLSTDVCSTFCATNGCSGWNMQDCAGVCYSGWNWIAADGYCGFDVGRDQAIMAYSQDSGGDMYFVNFPVNPSTCTLPVPYYGDFQAGQTYSITLDIGTYLPHYGFDLYFNIILVDEDKDPKWNNCDMVGTLTSTGESKSSRMSDNKNGGSTGTSISSGNVIVSSQSQCGDSGKWDIYERIILPNYIHNTTDAITIDLLAQNDNAGAVWNARQFILVARLCNIYCLTCDGPNIDQCYSCDVVQGYMLSGTTCATSCLPGYGPTANIALCVLCDNDCAICYGVGDNCSSCKTSNDEGFLFQNTTLLYDTCVNPCPDGYWANHTSQACQLCNLNCTLCDTSDTHCTECATDYNWYDYNCWFDCPTGFYQTNSGLNCSKCRDTCFACSQWDVCSICTVSGPNKAYLLNSTCYTVCPDGYYEDDNSGAGPNYCQVCAIQCATCTNNPSPCQSCNPGYYLYSSTCSSSCPDEYFAYDPWWECLLCETYCVDLTITMSFSDSTNRILYIDMSFSRDIDFNLLDYQTFQTIDITNNDINNFNIYYSITSASSYRITVQPKGYIFLYNETVTVTTREEPTTLDQSIDQMPFKTTNYLKEKTINWFLMNSPSLSDTEQSIVNGLNGINNVFASTTTSPVVAEFKKAGGFAMLFSGAHITSCSILINNIPPQNMYEGVRFWALSVFYDVPEWEQTSSIPNKFFTQEMHDLTQNQRRLFNLNSLYWRFQRTGMTSFFIYDCYIPLLLICVCWILAIIAKIMIHCNGTNFKSYEPKYFTVMHKIHQFSILYVTFAMMMEWIYFDAGSTERWVSLLVCLVFTIYFVGYHLYVYYDMIRYPEAVIGNDKYQYYVRRYSTFLKNLRYQEYDMKEEWSPKHWFRPYNYHLLSYYKKFCMIVALPVFYDSPHWQVAILVLLQGLELTRFLLTKPYYVLWRNVYRFCLQLALLLFFIVAFILGFLMDEIVKNDPTILETYVDVYYGLGWLGFALVWAFNIGFVVLIIIDIVQAFRKSGRQTMDEARRIYYYEKITEYEKDKDQVPLGLMNKWVKLGNLNDRNKEGLPDINVRIEYYKLIKHREYYDVDLLKIVELFMNVDFNFHQENNTTPGKKIKKRIRLSKEVSASLYTLVNNLYQKYCKKDTEAIIIKTFATIHQKEFEAGDRIPLLPEAMFQKIELETTTGDKEVIKLKEKLQGFPLNAFDVESI